MASINESILTALEQGHDPQSIIEYLKNSDKPEHQDWYNNYSANMQSRSAEKDVSKSNDGLLGFIEQNPKTSAAVGAAVLTAPIAIRGYNAYQERKTNAANAKLNERRVAAYENQVAKMGASPFDEGQPAGNISSDPLVEQRIRKAAAEADLAEFKLKQARDKLELKQVAQPAEVPPQTNLTPEQAQARMADLPKPIGVSPSFSQYQPNVNAPTGVPPTTSGIPQSAQPPASNAPVQNVAPNQPPVEKAKVMADFYGPETPTRRTSAMVQADKELKGRNQYLNMFGYDPKDPTSPRSQGALQAWNKFQTEALGGKLPAGASGNPEGYRNQYIPFVEQRANELAPETQSYLAKNRTKAQLGTVDELIAKGVPLHQQGKARIPGMLGTAAAAMAAIPIAQEAAKGNYAPAAEAGFDLGSFAVLGSIIGAAPAAVAMAALGSKDQGGKEQKEMDYQKRRQEAVQRGAANRGMAFDPRRVDLGINPSMYGY